MAIRTYKVTLDSKNTIAPEPVFLRQGDKTGAVVIDATLMDNGVPVSLDGLTPSFMANTADGKAVIADSTGFNIVNASGGEFTYQVSSQIGSVPGKIKIAYFSFTDASGNQSTFDVAFIIKKAADMTQESAKDWVSSLSDIIGKYNQWANDAHNSWEQFVNDNKAIIESVDPGGKVLSELIGFRHSDMLSKTFVTAKLRGDFFDQEFASRGINVEWYGAKGDGVTDDTAAIQQAIDKNPNQTILLRPGKTYNISKPLVFDKGQHFDGKTATIFLTEDADYAIKIMVTNSIVENFTLSKDKTTNASGILLMYNNNLVQNVVSKNCVWKVFIHCVDMKEGHLKQIRVDNDTVNETGSIFQFDHCLNNTMSDIFSGYADKGVYLSSISSEADASAGYENEGLTMTNVILVKNNIAIDIEKCTFLTITSCLFDFCKNWGVRYNEGFSLSITGCWIQVIQPDAVAIGAANETTAFGLISIQGNTITGQSTNTGQAAVNINFAATSATITGNTLLQIKGGAVRTKNSQISGNIVENGIGFYGYNEIQNIKTFYPTSTAPKVFTVPNAQIEFTATELGTLNYLYAIGSTGSDGVPHLTAVSNSGIAIASVNNDGSVAVINDAKDYSKMELVCKIYPFDHRQNSNIVLT